jgi:hypothetical protein
MYLRYVYGICAFIYSNFIFLNLDRRQGHVGGARNSAARPGVINRRSKYRPFTVSVIVVSRLSWANRGMRSFIPHHTRRKFTITAPTP